MKVFVKGDCHGDFKDVEYFLRNNVYEKSIIFLLGDVGVNYYGNKRDEYSKCELNNIGKKYNCYFICIRGNHDINPENLNYKKIRKFGNYLYKEDKYENIYYAIDGNIYKINKKTIFCCGGAYSVDKYYRLSRGFKWFSDEQPTEDDKKRCLKNLKKKSFSVDYILTHTCPYSAIPRFAFIPGIDQSKVDITTEMFFQELVDKGIKGKWFCGHYHIDKYYKGVTFLLKSFVEICRKEQ